MRVFDPTAERGERIVGVARLPPGRAKDTTLAGCIFGDNAKVCADRGHRHIACAVVIPS